MTPLLTDARLARQATGGDQRAFVAIYKRYHQDLYRFCLSILGRPEDAQDALQNTMIKALRSLPGEEREIQLKPWLYRVAHNESIDLLRKRRDGPELDDARESGAAEVADTVALRDRLSRLLADIGELPDRQRSALVMRELAGLPYEQIGEAFDTSVSVARQTVYEARLNLRELETGREMSCDQVTRQLSEADGRVTRRRDIQAHLRACAECRAFRDSIDLRRHDLAAISPLPAPLAASILHGLAGGQAATGIGGGAAAAAGVGTGAGKVAATSVALKAVATVAVVATVGVTAADRSGLIDASPGGTGSSSTASERQAEEAEIDAVAPTSRSAVDDSVPPAGIGGEKSGSRQGGGIAPSAAGDNPNSKSLPPDTGADKNGSTPGPSSALPNASQHGQETAAAHNAGGGQGHHQTATKHGKAPSRSAHPGRGSSGSHHGTHSHPAPAEHAKNGGGKSQPATNSQPTSPQPATQPMQPPTEASGGGETEAGTGTGNKLEPSP